MHVLIPIAFMPVLAVWLSSLPAVTSAVVALSVICMFGLQAPQFFATLTRRMRWIWLSLLVLFTCLTPGEYVFPQWPASPLTYEGILGAASQILHLLAMLSVIGFVLQKYSEMALMSGLYQWLSAWRLPSSALYPMLARTSLILQAQATVVEPLSLQRWLACFYQPLPVASTGEAECLTLIIQPLRRRESIVLWGMLLGLMVCWM